MAGRMDTPATGDLVAKRPSSGIIASSGQWEGNGLWREDLGDLISLFQPEGNKGQLGGKEAQATLFIWTEDKGERGLGAGDIGWPSGKHRVSGLERESRQSPPGCRGDLDGLC
ncbi:unnamed protein product [Caretta caretta]